MVNNPQHQEVAVDLHPLLHFDKDHLYQGNLQDHRQQVLFNHTLTLDKLLTIVAGKGLEKNFMIAFAASIVPSRIYYRGQEEFCGLCSVSSPILLSSLHIRKVCHLHDSLQSHHSSKAVS